jgi:hypothetical protein
MATLINLQEIAAWQICDDPAKAGDIIADLPALQRGSIWKVRQTEELWDSILRGFPIGSFIVSPQNVKLLTTKYKYQQDCPNRSPATHLLLDGQQRATAIALAFDDIWARHEVSAKAALWLDCSHHDSGTSEFNFRVLTRSHPWGYRLSNSNDILSNSAIRSALCAFKALSNSVEKRRPGDFAMSQTWPWDAKAPLPVALIIKSVLANPANSGAASEFLWKSLQAIPFMVNDPVFTNEEDRSVATAKRTLESQRQAVIELFEKKSIKTVIDVFDRALNGKRKYSIPLLLLDVASNSRQVSYHRAEDKDEIEQLFIRINSAGTALVGEELIYSLIKVEWPEVAEWMQNLPNRPALPSRVAALCIRLVLARHNKTQEINKVNIPTMPNISEFRRLMEGSNQNLPDFKIHLKNFIDRDASDLFNLTWEFVTLPSKFGDNDGSKNVRDFRLLSAQAVDLAQNSPDIFLMLLRWIDRLTNAGIDTKTIDERIHRRSLGFLTSIAWFAPDKEKACASIWSSIEADIDAQKLVNRFNNTRFKDVCRINKRLTLQMTPLPTPDELAFICNGFIKNDGRMATTKQESTVHFIKGSFWADKDWWYEKFCKSIVKSVDPKWKIILEAKDDDNDQEPDYSALVVQAVQSFANRLWEAKTTVLLYAQRKYLISWFPDFDPSLPEMIEDKNRPWDFDHILAQSYFVNRRGIAQSVREWGNSIGNLRAWPLEANRADGDATPSAKLQGIYDEEESYCIDNKLAASFIDISTDWPYWKEAVPPYDALHGGNLSHRYLANEFSEQYHDYRVTQ